MPAPFLKSFDSCIYMNPTHGPWAWSLDDRSRLRAGGREQWTVLSGTSAIGHGLHVADRAQGLGHIYTSIYYCCKSCPVLLHDDMVGGWIASYVFIFIFWSRCCCCCCVLLLLPTTSVLKRREVPPTVSSFSVSATTIKTFLCVYSIAVAAVEKGYHFLFFGRGAAAAAANHFSCWLRYCCCW